MIVCHSVAQIEVLAATDGSITIMQDGPGYSEPQCVVFYAEHVSALIRALREAKLEVGDA